MGWMRSKPEVAEVAGEVESFMGAFRAEHEWRETVRRWEAQDTAATESLRIALITNEKNAGRVVEIAAPYKVFLFGADGTGIGARVKALETAANVGYDTPEETVEAATLFAAHLNERA